MRRLGMVLAMALTMGWTGSAAAQDAAAFDLELNRLEQAGDICKVYLKFKNPEDAVIDTFKVDLVFFDSNEIIRNRLYVEFGPMPARKTRVRPFDIPDVNCGDLSSILVNDVVDCSAPGATAMSCLGRLALSSKTEVSLDY